MGGWKSGSTAMRKLGHEVMGGDEGVDLGGASNLGLAGFGLLREDQQ